MLPLACDSDRLNGEGGDKREQGGLTLRLMANPTFLFKGFRVVAQVLHLEQLNGKLHKQLVTGHSHAEHKGSMGSENRHREARTGPVSSESIHSDISVRSDCETPEHKSIMSTSAIESSQKKFLRANLHLRLENQRLVELLHLFHRTHNGCQSLVLQNDMANHTNELHLHVRWIRMEMCFG